MCAALLGGACGRAPPQTVAAARSKAYTELAARTERVQKLQEASAELDLQRKLMVRRCMQAAL